jgi:membrane protein implicated in regulation of membrane protease activity
MLLTGDAIWFGVPALAGTALFVVRMVLMLLGGDHGVSPDTDAGASPDGHDAAGAFKALSLQTVTAFAMGFGWGGILGLYTLNWPLGRSLLLACGTGVVMVWLLAVMLRMMLDLQSSGNQKLETTVGCEGEVYVGIPPKGQGSGQVKVVVSDRMRIINAQSEGEGVPSQARVRVVRVNGDNTVTVTPV